MEEQEIKLKAALFVLSQDGSVRKISCYDEEGVEGWEWEFEGKEWWDLGDWSEIPPIPDEMVEYVVSKYKDRL